MNYKDTRRVEISLIDLLVNIIMKWRLICIVTIITGMLFGVFQLFNNWKDYNNPVKIEAAKEEYKNNLETYTIDKETYEREIENLEKNIELNQKYIDEAILMKINPYDKPIASVDIFVKTSDNIQLENGLSISGVTSSSIIKAYSSYLNLLLTDKETAEQAETDPQYLKDLIEINTDYNTSAITLSVTHESIAKAQKLREYLIGSMYEIQTEVKNSLGEHEIYTLNQKEGVIVDLELDSKQNSYLQKNIEYEKQLTETKQLLSEIKEPKKQNFSKFSFFITLLKYIALGVVTGFCIIVFIIAGRMIIVDKVLSVNEINNTYQLPELGILFKDKKIRIFNNIDVIIQQLRGINLEIKDKQYEFMLTNINHYKKNSCKILLVGTVSDRVLQIITNELNKKTDQYQFDYVSNITYNLEALKKIIEYEDIIIVEEIASSCYKNIDKEIKILKQMKKNIIGSSIIIP